MNRQQFAYIGLIIAMALGLLALQVQTARLLRSNQIAACGRGNVLRLVLNANVIVTRDFLDTATRVRQEAADLSIKQGNKKEAAINQAAADRYLTQSEALVPVQTVDCQSIIK